MHRLATRLPVAGLLWLGCSAAPTPAPPSRPAPTAEEEPAVTPPAPAQAFPAAAASFPPSIEEDGWIEDRLRNKGDFGALLARPEHYRLQIIVTELDRTSSDRPTLVSHGYRVDAEYFFAASAIKTFASVAALRKLGRLEGRIDLNTPIALCGREDERCTRTLDRTNRRGKKITLGHEIRKMHLVSNNQAFNRLYDFVGHRELNEELQGLGFESLRVRHRMGQQHTLGRTTPRVEFQLEGEVFSIPRRESDLVQPPTELPGTKVGSAFINRDKKLVREPRDFALKNYVSMRDLHLLQLALLLPDLGGCPDLGLSSQGHAFLLRAMTEDPSESDNPRFIEPRFAGRRYKLMSAGIERVMPFDRVRYVNKPGRAYGFHIENAYVEDTKTGRAFFVTAGIYVNENGVINDNRYEYDEISRPFFENLGETLATQLLVEG